MFEYDTTLKEVLLESAGLTLRQLTGLEIRTWRDVELPQVANPRIDLLGETDSGALVHIELQSTNDAKMALRMAKYGLHVYELHDKFPLQVVLYLGADPLRMSDRLVLSGLSSEYKLCDIRNFDGTQLCDSPCIGDNIISILAKWPDRLEGIRRILKRIAEREPARRGKALAQLMILAGLRKLGTDIEREVKQMPILDDILDHEVLGREYKRGKVEGRQEGKQEGWEEGQQEGEQKGRQEGELFVLQRQLVKRFGPLPAWAEERLANSSARQLEKLADQVLEATSLEDLLP